MSTKELPKFKFSESIDIYPEQVFFITELSFAFVNVRPAVPGIDFFVF